MLNNSWVRAKIVNTAFFYVYSIFIEITIIAVVRRGWIYVGWLVWIGSIGFYLIPKSHVFLFTFTIELYVQFSIYLREEIIVTSVIRIDAVKIVLFPLILVSGFLLTSKYCPLLICQEFFHLIGGHINESILKSGRRKIEIVVFVYNTGSTISSCSISFAKVTYKSLVILVTETHGNIRHSATLVFQHTRTRQCGFISDITIVRYLLCLVGGFLILFVNNRDGTNNRMFGDVDFHIAIGGHRIINETVFICSIYGIICGICSCRSQPFYTTRNQERRGVFIFLAIIFNIELVPLFQIKNPKISGITSFIFQTRTRITVTVIVAHFPVSSHIYLEPILMIKPRIIGDFRMMVIPV